MKLLPVFLAGLASIAPLSAQPRPAFVRDRVFETRLEIHGRLPIWGGRALLGVEDSVKRAPLLYLADAQGNREEFLFSIPESSLIGINGLAHIEDGTIGLCGWATTDSALAATFLALISPDRKRQTLIRTFPYVPSVLALPPDGTVWAAGWMMDDTGMRVVANNVLRRYERSGRLLQSWSVRTKGGRDLADATAVSHLMPSSDRVGWLATGGEYFEFSLDGRQIGRYDPAPGVDFNVSDPSSKTPHQQGAALSRNNLMLLAVCADRACRLLALDRENRDWVAEDRPEHGWRRLIGIDGEDPVMYGPRQGAFAPIWHYKRNPPPAQ